MLNSLLNLQIHRKCPFFFFASNRANITVWTHDCLCCYLNWFEHVTDFSCSIQQTNIYVKWQIFLAIRILFILCRKCFQVLFRKSPLMLRVLLNSCLLVFTLRKVILAFIPEACVVINEFVAHIEKLAKGREKNFLKYCF